MTTMHIALIVAHGSIPKTDAVVHAVAEQGHRITFPRGFEFGQASRDPWIAITLDGTKTGFDVALSTVESLADDDPRAAERLARVGTHLLGFGARGQDSVRAVAVVVRAVAALSAASAWVEEELVPAADVPGLLDGIVSAAQGLESAIAALPRPSRAEQQAAFAAMRASGAAPAPPRRTGRAALWILFYVGMALVGWFVAIR